MKPIDIKDLVNGLITLVFLSIAIGQYGRLREFAKEEFVKSMRAQRTSTFGAYKLSKGGRHE